MIRIVQDSLSLPRFFCWLLLPLIGLGFVIQVLQVRSLLAVTAAPTGTLDVRPAAVSGLEAASLFGLGATSGSLPASRIKLRLLACFVQSESDRSVALIAVENQPPRRVIVGEQIVEGLRLQKVESRRVLLSQDGHSVSLGLQRSRALVVDATIQAPAGSAR